MKKLIIIPAYNEDKNILRTYKSIVDYNKKHKTNYDVVVINDGSTDDTEIVLNDNNIPHIKLIKNLGIGGAVQTGYKYALENDYDVAIQFDGDGQHDINSIDDVVKPIVDGKSNMVIGSRFVKNTANFKSTKARRIGIKIISNVIKFKTGIRIKDTTSGYRAIDKNIIKLFAHDYPVEYPEPISTVNAIKNGYKVVEVHANMFERKAGKSSISSWKNIYYMINVILSILIQGGK